jgi:hypothetical protein
MGKGVQKFKELQEFRNASDNAGLTAYSVTEGTFFLQTLCSLNS